MYGTMYYFCTWQDRSIHAVKVIKSHPLLFLYDKQVMSQSAYVRISMFAPWHIGHFNNSDDMKNNYQVIWQ